MNRAAIVILTAIALGAPALPAAPARSKEFKVIQNAVNRDRPAAERDGDRGRELRWLKVLIRDSGPGGAQIKVTLPAAIIELVLAHGDGRRFKVDDDHGEIDLQACWRALKKAGPRALVEIRDDGAVFKVWLE